MTKKQILKLFELVTTASYDRRGEETLRSAVQRLSMQDNLE
jgi:hypothetical protein